MQQDHNARLFQFMMEHFDDAALEVFAQNYFPEVRREFTQDMLKSRKVLLLLDRCRHNGRLPDLLAALERELPHPYRQNLADLPITSPPAPESSAQRSLQPPQRDAEQVFLSHAHQDTELAQRIATDLEVRGWRVWIAPDSIRPGERWVEAIQRGLDSCSLLVVLISPAAVTSRWVQTEANLAIEMEHEGHIRFVPILVQPTQMPSLWRAYQHINLQRSGYDSAFARLLAALSNGAGTVSPGTTTPSDTLTKEEEQAIKRTVKTITDATPVPYQTIYAELHYRFGVRRYKDLPRSRFDEALRFLQHWGAKLTGRSQQA